MTYWYLSLSVSKNTYEPYESYMSHFTSHSPYRSLGDSVDKIISSGSTKWLIDDSLRMNFSFSSSSFIIFSFLFFLIQKLFLFRSNRGSEFCENFSFSDYRFWIKKIKMTHHTLMTNLSYGWLIQSEKSVLFQNLACVQVGIPGPNRHWHWTDRYLILIRVGLDGPGVHLDLPERL